MNKIRDIITTKQLPQAISFITRYPGHVDLDISNEFVNADGFIVMTAQAADQLCTQLQEAVKEAYARAEREHPLFEEDA